MTHRQTETSREIRLWINQVIVPVGSIVVTAMMIPEVRETAKNKFNSVKDSIKSRIKSKKG